MAKLFFPFTDQPKKFPFVCDKPIRFPFLIENLLYVWEITAQGAYLRIHSADITKTNPIVKDIMLENSGITFYLDNSQLGLGTAANKSIYITFEQLGMGIHTLGLLDGLYLGGIDNLTLGEISQRSANWLAMGGHISDMCSEIESSASHTGFKINSEAQVSYSKTAYISIDDKAAITGLQSVREATLGDIDGVFLRDLDSMLHTFYMFGNIPAALVKGIFVTDGNTLAASLSGNYTVLDKGIMPVSSPIGITNKSLALTLDSTNMA